MEQRIFLINLDADEWTQEDFLRNKQLLEKEGVKVILIDTILNSIEGTESIVYNPPLLSLEPSGSIFVFYCDTGKSTRDRLKEFRKRFPDKVCISLRGGRGYWRKNLRINIS